MTDSSGAVATRYSYDPYGQITSSSGTVANPWKFGGAYGAYTDAGTGLVKIGQRSYDPALGRWTQPDPKLMPFDLVQSNRYSYAGCNPVNHIDPTGMSHCGGRETFSYALTAGGAILGTFAAVALAPPTFGGSLLVASVALPAFGFTGLTVHCLYG